MNKVLFPLYVLIILSVSGCANIPSKSYYMDTQRGVVINSKESQHFKETIMNCVNQEKEYSKNISQSLHSTDEFKKLCITKSGYRKLEPHEYSYIVVKQLTSFRSN